MTVSVIIPVYNAELYVQNAIASALEQPEVTEVIVVEDGATDNSLAIVRQIAEQEPKVLLFRHENGENKGAGASRNLGLEKASADYIAFLDADDQYRPNRFQQAKTVFEKEGEADGIYEAIGVNYYDDEGKRKALKYHDGNTITTVKTSSIPPAELFQYICTKAGEYFHLNGLTLKRSFVQGRFSFDENLRQAQDTDFIREISLAGQLYPGSISQPVAIRGVHRDNRVFDLQTVERYRAQLAEKWFMRMLDESWPRSVNWALVIRQLESQIKLPFFRKNRPLKWLAKSGLLFIMLIKRPTLLCKLV